MNRTFIVAEAGVNHNGSLEMAFQLIDAAVAAGVDAVKFQTFEAEKFIAVNAPKAGYQEKATGTDESQLEMIRKLELDETSHSQLFQYCQNKDVQFLSSPFDMESIDLLIRLGLEIFKIPSSEINNLPYLRKMGALKKKLIMSTGMAELGEIDDALDVLAKSGTPLERITVLHCSTEYPTPFADVNLRAMLTIQNAFPGIAVGYSDHTKGIEVPIAAVAMGATIIEKHFTLDRNLPGPDHKASLEPDELRAMVAAIRNIEDALGDGIKRPSAGEMKNIQVARKSLVAARKIIKGEHFNRDNVAVKRPGTGLSPMRYDWILKCAARKDIEADTIITLEHVAEVCDEMR